MAVATISGIPASFRAGDTLKLSLSDSSHPASAWYLDFILGRNGIQLSKTRATADGDDYAITLTATASALITPGRCNVSLMFTEIATDERESEDGGWMLVLPDPNVSRTPSANETALAACSAAIAIIVANPEQTVNFNGQSFTQANLPDLFAAQDRLQDAVNAELSELGLSQRGGPRVIRFRFT